MLAWWRCGVWAPHPQRRESRAWPVREGVKSGRYSLELGHWRGGHSFRKILHFWKSLFSCVPLLSLPALRVHIFVIFSVWLCRCLFEFWKATWEPTNFRIFVWMTDLIISFGNSSIFPFFLYFLWKLLWNNKFLYFLCQGYASFDRLRFASLSKGKVSTLHSAKVEGKKPASLYGIV